MVLTRLQARRQAEQANQVVITEPAKRIRNTPLVIKPISQVLKEIEKEKKLKRIQKNHQVAETVRKELKSRREGRGDKRPAEEGLVLPTTVKIRAVMKGGKSTNEPRFEKIQAADNDKRETRSVTKAAQEKASASEETSQIDFADEYPKTFKAFKRAVQYRDWTDSSFFTTISKYYLEPFITIRTPRYEQEESRPHDIVELVRTKKIDGEAFGCYPSVKKCYICQGFRHINNKIYVDGEKEFIGVTCLDKLQNMITVLGVLRNRMKRLGSFAMIDENRETFRRGFNEIYTYLEHVVEVRKNSNGNASRDSYKEWPATFE